MSTSGWKPRRRQDNTANQQIVDIWKRCQALPPLPLPDGQPPNQFDTVGQISAYEAGDLDTEETIVLFQHLVSTGLAWELQGAYGRMAHALIENGLVTE